MRLKKVQDCLRISNFWLILKYEFLPTYSKLCVQYPWSQFTSSTLIFHILEMILLVKYSQCSRKITNLPWISLIVLISNADSWERGLKRLKKLQIEKTSRLWSLQICFFKIQRKCIRCSINIADHRMILGYSRVIMKNLACPFGVKFQARHHTSSRTDMLDFAISR